MTRANSRLRAISVAGVLMAAATTLASGDPKTETRHNKARSLFLDACTACHTVDRIEVQHLSAEEWRGVIAGMLSEGVPLTEEETTLVVEYLAENFGPDQH